MTEGQIIAAIIAVAGLAVTIGINAVATLLRIYKSPKEVTGDLASEVQKLRGEHHALAREVSTMSGSMHELTTSLNGLRDQVTALTNVMGVYNAGRNGRR